MPDPFRKRQAIERGELQTWTRRGRSRHAGHSHVLDVVVRRGLRMTGLYGRGTRNALRPVLRYVRLGFDTLPAAFSGFKILHLSDLHIDGCEPLVEAVCGLLSGEEVDLCVLTGDYRFGLTGPCEPIYPLMERLLAGLTSRHGFAGTLGNHDLSEMLPAFERMGISMLMNQSLEVRQGTDSVWVIGLDDPHYFGCDDLSDALASVPAAAFKILLVHTPEVFEEALQHGVNLYLCGHTHGGQLCLPLIGPVKTNAASPRKFARGVWQHKTLLGYTSSGVGCSGIRARLLCPPELVLIELCHPGHETTTQTAIMEVVEASRTLSL
jgi:predicted MPP superfamily phosphohydrolase